MDSDIKKKVQLAVREIVKAEYPIIPTNDLVELVAESHSELEKQAYFVLYNFFLAERQKVVIKGE